MKPSLSVVANSTGAKTRFYKRFATIKQGDWWANGSSQDMVKFTPSRNIHILGIGLWELYDDDEGKTMKLKV